MAVSADLTTFRYIRGEALKWARFVASLGFSEFVSPEDGFTTELSSQERWRSATSAGIYIWITWAGEAYVGQAVNVRDRLRQHWKANRAIAYVAFQPFGIEQLDQAERQFVKAVEKMFPVLNVKLAISSAAHVPFDDIMIAGELKAFLEGADSAGSSAGWRDWPLLQRKQREKFARFAHHRRYQQALIALRTYIERCIPRPVETEVAFWSVTLLPTSRSVFRVNVGQQEVFTLWEDDSLLFARYLSTAPLSDDHDGPLYQSNSYANFTRTAVFALSGQQETARCRELVIWLMRHTTPLNSGSHCPQFVRAACA